MFILKLDDYSVIVFDVFLLILSIITYFKARWINVIYNDEMECYEKESKEERTCKIYVLIGLIFIILKLVYDIVNLFGSL